MLKLSNFLSQKHIYLLRKSVSIIFILDGFYSTNVSVLTYFHKDSTRFFRPSTVEIISRSRFKIACTNVHAPAK